MPSPVSQTLDSAVKLLIQHRLKNPAIVQTHNLKTDYDSVRDELIAYNAKLNGVKTTTVATPKKSAPLLPMPAAVRAVASAVVKLAAGNALLIDWVGQGGQTVDQEVANSRAAICANCPKNSKDALAKLFTMPVSGRIKQLIEWKNSHKLTVADEDALEACEICLCPIKLKAWTPIDFIAKHTSDTVMAEFPEWCWIPNEIARSK